MAAPETQRKQYQLLQKRHALLRQQAADVEVENARLREALADAQTENRLWRNIACLIVEDCRRFDIIPDSLGKLEMMLKEDGDLALP